MAEYIGDISFYSNRAHWKIPYFFDIPQEINTEIRSPSFEYEDRRWTMIIYPNGNQYEYPDSAGWFGMHVRCSDSFSWGRYDIRLGIVGKLEEDIVNYSANGSSIFRRTKLIRRSAIESNKDRIVPGGHLHLFISTEGTDDSAVNQVMQLKSKDGTEKCTGKLKSAAIEASTQTEEDIGTEKTTKKLNSAVIEAYTQTGEDIEINELQLDFKEMLVHGNISDVILKLKDHEFKVHRCVLAARSPVLLDMMTHDREAIGKNTGVVELSHLDPDIFSVFLNYLYTGNVENINSKIVKELFSVADSYKVNGLRKICLNHIMEDISVDNFCDMLTLSLRHGEECLKEACTQFFAKNSLNIILTPKWKAFLAANPEAGNELFVKQLQRN